MGHVLVLHFVHEIFIFAPMLGQEAWRYCCSAPVCCHLSLVAGSPCGCWPAALAPTPRPPRPEHPVPLSVSAGPDGCCDVVEAVRAWFSAPFHSFFIIEERYITEDLEHTES